VNRPSFAFSRLSPSTFVVQYGADEDLRPERQGPLVAALRDASRHGPLAVVFVVGAAVRIVSMSVPTFWLEQVEPLRITTVAVVSPSMAVRVATASFGAANALLGRALRVKPFVDEGTAIAWARAAAPAGS